MVRCLTSVPIDSPRGTARAELVALARLAWPITSAQMLLVSMGLVDTAVLGRVSVTELAGATIGRSIGFGVASISMGIGMGLEPLASQALGAGETGRAWGALVATLKAIALTWIPVALLGMAITFLLEPMGVAHEITVRARWYLTGQLPGLGLYGAYIAARTYLQAHGNARAALFAALIANLMNWIVCNVLVRGDEALLAVGLPGVGLPPLGAFGAGLATSLAEIVLVGIALYAARARHAGGASEPVLVRTVLAVGIPVGLQLFAELGIFSLVALVSGRLGEVPASAHQVAIGLASFTYMASLGVSAATSVRVGNAVGEGTSPRRVGLLGIGLGGGLQAMSAVVFALFPRQLVGLFSQDARVVDLGAKLVMIAAVFQLFDGVQGVASGALRGAGDVRFAFLANVVAYWAIGLPVALWLGFGLGLGAPGLWGGLTLGLVIVAFVLVARFVVLTRGKIERVEKGRVKPETG